MMGRALGAVNGVRASREAIFPKYVVGHMAARALHFEITCGWKHSVSLVVFELSSTFDQISTPIRQMFFLLFQKISGSF